MLFSTVKYKYLAWIEGLRRAAQTVIIIFASHHRFLLRITYPQNTLLAEG